MSSDKTIRRNFPDHWEIGGPTDPVPPEILLGGPSFRCRLDGTRVWSGDDADLHDEHFHRKVEDGRPEPDDGFLRHEALQHAVASQRGPETGAEIVARAEAMLAFLRGQPASRESQEDAAYAAAER